MIRHQREHNSPSQSPDRRAVVVLGMHRSGTSALCGALNLMGVDFGKHLMPATDANEKGHWEHEEIVRAHNRLLYSLGSCWDDDKPLPADWVDREITHEVRSHLVGILDRDFGQSSLFGMKDPRLCLLLPLWFPIFQTLHVKPHFVLVVRHPWEVAESLAKRNGIEHPQSYLLWLDHVVQAESATRNHKRSFVRYEEMVDDPVAILNELREQLGGDLRMPSQIQTLLRQFLDPSLRHHQFNKKADILKQPVPQLALDFYETIRKASTWREITKKLEPLATRFILGRGLLYRRSIRTEMLSAENVSKISLEVSEPPREVHVSALFWLDAKVTNETDETLSSVVPFPVGLAYHWIEKATRQMVVFEGNRSRLSSGVEPNTATRYPMKIVAPNQPGEYILQTTIVQEGVCWFEDIRSGIVQEFAVSVIAGTNLNTVDSSGEASQSPVAESEEIRVLSSHGAANTKQLDRIASSADWWLLNFFGPIKSKFVNPLFRFFNSSGEHRLTEKDACSVEAPVISDGWQQPISEADLPADSIVAPMFEATGRAPVNPHPVRVDIIVCVHSRLDIVKRCLQALRQFTNMPYSFILIDDGNDDGTRTYLVDFALAEGAMLLRNDVRTGFARTADKGLRHSNAEYVLLLSSDVEVEPAWLERMVACAESDDLIGLVGPLSNYDTRQPFFQMGVGWAGNTPSEAGKSTHSAATITETLTQIYPRVPFLNGFCVMIKRAVINQVGYLDGADLGECLAETTAYCLRVSKAGWQLALATDVNVFYEPS